MKRLLVVAIALLALAGCKEKKGEGAAAAAVDKVAPRVARIYFEAPSMLLAAEARNVNLPKGSAAAIPIVLAELLKGPVNPGLLRIFPEDTVLRGAYLLPDGTALVDLGGATLTGGWPTGSHDELMATYSLVQTVTGNFPDAKRLRILVNGAPAETLAGHVALDRSLRPDPTLVDPHVR